MSFYFDNIFIIGLVFLFLLLSERWKKGISINIFRHCYLIFMQLFLTFISLLMVLLFVKVINGNQTLMFLLLVVVIPSSYLYLGEVFSREQNK